MPYVKQKDRKRLFTESRNQDYNVSVGPTNNPGELNYVLTELIQKHLSERGINYTNINEVIGVLECCKLELYRRLAAPYEDVKIKENGDVYE